MDCINEVASTVYYEARGEGVEGMRSVAHVIYNRAREQGKRPCIIVRQPKQFATGPSRPNDRLWQLAKRIVLDPGEDITRGATYFHANWIRKPQWAYRFRVTLNLGNHIFYRP